MNFERLVRLTSTLSCFSTAFLFAGENPQQVRLQLNRWIHEGKVIRIHKGLYTLAEPYRKVPVEAPVLAQNLHTPSYMSLHAALHWYHLIPEYVPSTTSVTTSRPKTIHTPFGEFIFRHLNKKYFRGYRSVELQSTSVAYIASPEKALLDLVYLTPGGDTQEYLSELRLQNMESLDMKRLFDTARIFRSKKINRACSAVAEILSQNEVELL